MAWLFPWLLFVHVMGAILAFGPTYAFGTYAGLAARERGPALSFNNRARGLVTRRMVTPGTLIVIASGALIVWARDIPWLDPYFRWLQLSIVLVLGMLAWNLSISVPRQKRIAELGAQAAAGGPPPTGPPPEMAALIKRVRTEGKAMGVLVVIVVFLMVVKPPMGA